MSVYKLVNKLNDETIYIGSTIKPLSARLSLHKTVCFNQNYNGYHLPVYKKIRKIGWDNVKCVILESCPEKTIKDLHKLETKYISKLNPLKNTMKKSAIDTEQEPNERACKRCQKVFYYKGYTCKECKKEQRQKYFKAYYLENKDKYQIGERKYASYKLGKGLCYDKLREKYKAYIMIKVDNYKKPKTLGYFNTLEEAKQAIDDHHSSH